MIYVDILKEYPLGTVRGAERVKYWCHMWADSIDELHRMAVRIGMRVSWFQGLPKHKFPHYDLSKTRRNQALLLGAVDRSETPMDLEEYRRICALQG